MEFEVGQIFEATVVQITKKGSLICHIAYLPNKIREVLIHGILFNAKTSQPFVTGDLVRVVVTKAEPVEAALTKEYVRPLLIFDMHGVLGEREPWERRRKDGKRKFIKRPYSEEFIKFCSNYFELAVWSCGKKKNIDIHLFAGIKLLFVWCQDESTNLYPRTSCVSSDKPLFLKELSRVWNTFYSFDETNTILLENHIEKCENNPFGTCLIVPDFLLDSVGDEVLDPTGYLAQELVAIASQSNISQFLIQKAGSSSFYPTSYSQSLPHHHHTHHSTHQQHQQQTAELALPLPPPPALATRASSGSSSQQLLSFLTGNHSAPVPAPPTRPTPTHSPAINTVTFICQLFQEKPHSSLREIHERLLHSSPSLLPLSADTALFILNPFHSEFCFLTRGGGVSSGCRLEYLFVALEKQLQWTEWISSLGGVTVIDGKLIYDPQKEMRKFLCRDIFIMNGTHLLLSSDQTCQQRQGLLGVWLFDSPFDENILGSSIEFVHQLSVGGS